MFVAIIVQALFDVPGFTVMFIKNKYSGDQVQVTSTGSPSILVNIEVAVPGSVPHIVEVQVYLDQFLSLKKHQHKTYEFVRALGEGDYASLLRPIYKPLWVDLHVYYV